MQQEEHGAVAHVGQARPVAARRAAGMFGLDFLADVLPVLAEGRIGEHIAELFVGEQVAGKGVLTLDVLRILALHQHVSLGDGVGFFVDLLTVEMHVEVGVDRAE